MCLNMQCDNFEYMSSSNTINSFRLFIHFICQGLQGENLLYSGKLINTVLTKLYQPLCARG